MNFVNKNIKFPDKQYVAYRKDGEDIIGFMTPWGTDSAAKKRMATVDAWYENGRRKYDWETKTNYIDDSVNEPMVFENMPLSGFVIEKRLNRGGSWYGSQDKWKIEDPRGFQLEISGNNLLQLIKHCMITEGMISGSCVWAREGQNNVLVPVNSDLYKETLENTKRMKAKFSLADLNPGDMVEFATTGELAIFEGRYYTIEETRHSDNRYALSSKKKYVFSRKYEYASTKEIYFFHVSEPKISAVIDKKEKVHTIDEILANGSIHGAQNYAYGLTDIKTEVRHVWEKYEPSIHGEVVVCNKNSDGTYNRFRKNKRSNGWRLDYYKMNSSFGIEYSNRSYYHYGYNQENVQPNLDNAVVPVIIYKDSTGKERRYIVK